MRNRCAYADRRRSRGDRGAVAVEFALVAPVLFVLLFSIVQVGWAYFRANTIEHAIENAARAALLDSSLDEAALQDLVDAELAGFDPDLAVDLSLTLDMFGPVTVAGIRASYTQEIMLPLFPNFDATFDIEVLVPQY